MREEWEHRDPWTRPCCCRMPSLPPPR
jgi:hypothetical protein